jgi:uncharacterized membrane protein YgcG
MGLTAIADQLPAESTFTDGENIVEWARPSVLLSHKIGFVQGIDSGLGTVSFEPRAVAERQALARLAYEYHSNREIYMDKARLLIAVPPKDIVPADGKQTPVGGGGGGGGGGAGGTGGATVPPVPPINQPGTITGDYSITTNGTYGPPDGTGTVNVTGTLIIDPGSNGEVTLQNVNAANIEVRSGSANTIRIRNVRSSLIVLNAQNQLQSLRLLVMEGTLITKTEVRSKAIIETQSGNPGLIHITAEAANQLIMLRGEIPDGVSMTADGAQLVLAPTSTGGETRLAFVEMSANGKIEAHSKAAIRMLRVSQAGVSIEIAGQGKIEQIGVHAAATGVTIHIVAGISIDKLILPVAVKLIGDAGTISKMTVEISGDGRIDADESILSALKAAMIIKVNAAIEGIAIITEYTSELDQLQISIRNMLQAALMLGAQANDFANIQKLIDAENVLTEFGLAKAKESLQIIVAVGDKLEHITQDISLPLAGIANTAVGWELSDTTHITKGGKITRPQIGASDSVVRITATISRKGKTVYKTFTATIKALQAAGTEVTLLPTVNQAVYSHSAWITGLAEPKASLSIKDEAGQLVGKSGADGLGKFTIPLLRQLKDNEQLRIVAQGTNKQPSAAAPIQVIQAEMPTIITAKPEVGDELYTDTTKLNVSSVEPVVIWLAKADGTVLDAKFIEDNYGVTSNSYYTYSSSSVSGSISSGSGGGSSGGGGGGGGGTFVSSGYTSMISIEASLSAGEQISVLARSNGKKPSGSTIRTVKELSGKTAVPVLIGKAYNQQSELQVFVERGSVVYMNGAPSGQGMVATTMYSDGKTDSIKLSFPVPMATGQSFELSAKAPGKLTGDSLAVKVEAGGETSQAPFVGKSSDNRSLIGLIPNNSTVYIRDASGKMLYSSTEYNNEDFVSFNYYFDYDPSAPTETVYASSKEQGKLESEGKEITINRRSMECGNCGGEAPDIQTETPVLISSSLYFDGGTIELQAQPYDRSFLLYSNYSGSISWGNIPANQSIVNVEFNTGPVVQGQENFILTVQQSGKISSKPVYVPIKIKQLSTSLTGVSINYTGFYMNLSGKTVPGSAITVKRASDGKVMFGPEFTFTNSSNFSFILHLPTLADLQPGEHLEVTARHYGLLESTTSVFVPSLAKTLPLNLRSAEVYQDGGTLEWTGNRAVKVVVKDERGVTIGQSTEVGQTTLKLSNIQGKPQKLAIYVQEANLLASDPVYINVLPDTSQTATPYRADKITDQSRTLQGNAEPRSSVIVRNAAGLIIGTSMADELGVFKSYLYYALHEGEKVSITADGVGKRESEPLTVTVAESDATKQPSFVEAVNDESYVATMQVETSPVYTSLILTNDSGNLIGFYKASFFYEPIRVSLFNKLGYGQQLHAQAKAYGKKISSSQTIAVVQAPLTPQPTINGNLYDIKSFSVSIAAESGTTIYIRKEDGTLLYSNGSYSNDFYVNYYEIVPSAGETVLVTAKRSQMKESLPLKLTIQEAQRTSTPTVTGVVYSESARIDGFAKKGATVKLANAEGIIVGNSYASSLDGAFTIYLYSGVPLSGTINLTAAANTKKESLPRSITVQLSLVTSSPTVTKAVYQLSNEVQGTSEPSASLFLRNAQGNLLSSGIASANGDFNFSVYPSAPFKVGEQLYVTAKAINKSISSPAAIQVLASPKTGLPTVTGNVYENGFYITGTTEQSAFVNVNMQNGTQIVWFYADSSGKFSNYRYQQLTAGTQVNVIAKAYNKVDSDPVMLKVFPLSGKTVTWGLVDNVNQASGEVTIYSDPDTKVNITHPSGFFWEKITDSQGKANFTYSYYPGYPLGEQWTLTAMTIGKNVSDPIYLTVK